MLDRFATQAMHKLPPETAHRLTIQGLKVTPPLALAAKKKPDPALAVSAFGLTFPGPVGLAAGFDKDGDVWRQMLALGFSHVEVGTVTPQPQPGNPAPRVFRLSPDRAVINRMGFPSEGAAMVLPKFQGRSKNDGILGLNIGKNKAQEDAITDYVSGLKTFATVADYVTINISSPNTPGLRDLQGKAALIDLLTAILETKLTLRPDLPLLLKVAPDLDHTALSDITDAVMNTKVSDQGIDGLIVSNTTLARPVSLRDNDRTQTGGLSGAPLMAPSTEVLRQFSRATEGKLPLIGVGGVANAADAWEKICAGATLVQVYTGMIYGGPYIARTIHKDLMNILKRSDFTTFAEAVGSHVK